jgi:hypothetical protein
MSQLLPLRPRPFSQPSPDVTAAGGHPHKNLGRYLHAPKERKRQNERKVEATGRQKFVPADGEYKPKGRSRDESTYVKTATVAGPNEGQSDINSEAIGSLLGPAPVSATPSAFKSRKAKAKQMPFYG